MIEHRARIGEIVIGKGFDQLVAIALGSCVAVIIYDPKVKVAALAHVALPGGLFNREKAHNGRQEKLGRYADTAITECIRLLKIMGVKPYNFKAKIAGGSTMFGTKGLLGLGLKIGDRNILASKENLKFNNIGLQCEDVGGNMSRTVRFDIDNTMLTIKKGFNTELLYI